MGGGGVVGGGVGGVGVFFFQAEGGIRDRLVTGVQTCALPICRPAPLRPDLLSTVRPVVGVFRPTECWPTQANGPNRPGSRSKQPLKSGTPSTPESANDWT